MPFAAGWLRQPVRPRRAKLHDGISIWSWVVPPGVGQLAEMLRLKYAACRFAPADVDLFSDHRQGLFRPVLDLHNDPFLWRQAYVQIHLRPEIGDEFHSPGKAIVHRRRYSLRQRKTFGAKRERGAAGASPFAGDDEAAGRDKTPGA